MLNFSTGRVWGDRVYYVERGNLCEALTPLGEERRDRVLGRLLRREGSQEELVKAGALGLGEGEFAQLGEGLVGVGTVFAYRYGGELRFLELSS